MEELIQKTLDQFETDLKSILSTKYIDILIYGSIVLNDFTPHKGDIDFVVIIENDLNENEIKQIYSLHEKYRNNIFNNLEYQLEGVYYPIAVLTNPFIDFIGCYIGTRRKGWKQITKNVHNCFDMIQFKNYHYCKNKTSIDFYTPSFEEIKNCIINDYNIWNKYVDDEDVPSYVVVQWAARTIYYLNKNEIGSKTKSCIYMASKYQNNEFFKYCGGIRHPFDKSLIKDIYPNEKEYAKNAISIIGEYIKNW